MSIGETIYKNETRLKSLIDIFTFIYLASIYVFAGGFEHWIQSYSNFIAVVYMFFLACYAWNKKDQLKSSYSLSIIPFLALCALSFFWALDKRYCLKLTVELVAMYTLTSLMYNYLVQEHKISLILNGLYIGGICLMFGTVLYYGIPDYFKGFLAGNRMGHILGNLNDVGVHCSYSALIALYYCLYKKKWLNLIPSIMLMIFASGTGSRKVVIFLISGIFLLIFCMKGWKAKILAFVSVATILLIYLYVPLFEGTTKRVLNMVGAVSGETDGSTAIRIQMIKHSLVQFKKTPILGIGLGSSHVFLKQAMDFDSYSHNNYIELLLILGSIGFILWYIHYLLPIKKIVKSMLKKEGLATLIFVFMILGLIMHIGAVEYVERFQIILIMLFYTAVKEIQSTDAL